MRPILLSVIALILTFSVGSALSGPLVPVAIDELGPAGLPGFFALALLGIAGLALLRIRARRRASRNPRRGHRGRGLDRL
jgi:hypothetical protein